MHTHIQTNMRTNTQTHDMMDTYKHKPLSLSNMGGGKDRATVGRGDDVSSDYRALLRKMTCILRHPMGLRHPLSLSNMGGGKDRATVGRGDDTGGYKKRLKNETTLQLDRIGVLGKGGLPNSHISGASLQHFFNKNPRKSRGTYSE